MALERIFPATSLQTAGGRILPTPAQFYLTGEDRVRIVSANSLAGVSLKVQLRTANFAGDTVPHSFDHTPNSDRSIKREDYAIGSGSLLNVTVFARTGAPLIGQVFVIIQLIRGAGVNAIVLGTILAGYVTATQALGFPGSPIRTSIEGDGYVRYVTGTTPAAGVNIAEVVPTGARWDLLRVYATFTTSGVAGNRFVCLALLAAGPRSFLGTQSTSQGPTQAAAYSWAQGVQQATDVTNVIWQNPIPSSAILLAADSFTTYTPNLGVADQFSAPQYVVREWLEVP